MTPPIYKDGRLVLEEYYPEPFQLLPDLDVKSTWWPGNSQEPRCWYHEKLVGSDHLLICAGDSWTWGDSLSTKYQDDQYRLDHIYGTVLSSNMGCDFLQLAECGCSNYDIYDRLKFALHRLCKKYPRITVVVTLTENGRELKNTDHWVKNINRNNLQTLDQFLEQYEQNMFQDFHDMFATYSNTTPVIARNFTYSFESNRSILGTWLAALTWVDILAQNQNLPEYPKTLRFLAMQAINPLTDYLEKQKLNFDFKKSMMPCINQALIASRWLDRSQFNNKHATKHPTELGHKFWAEYLTSILSK